MALIITRVLDSRFEFSLDGGDPISDNAPKLTTIGDITHFKTSNGANLIKEQNILFSDVTVIDTFGGTGSFTFANIQNLWTKLIELNFFAGLNGSGGGSGVTRFDALLDAFQYFGNDGKVPVVNESQQLLTATTFYNHDKLTELSDVSITNMVEGKFISVQDVGGELKFVLSDIDTVSTGTNLKKIIIIAEANETGFQIDNNPNSIFLFRNGSWQVESYDFTYASGTITPLQTVNEGDYYEVIPLSNEIKKFPVSSTIDNQTEFNFDGNPAFSDAYLKGTRLREGIDYTRTLFSDNNKIIIINQYLINDIRIGDILEIITY